MLTDKELAEIRRKMLEVDEDPPVAGWNKIQADIKPPRRRFPYWWVLGGALLLGSGVGLVYLQQQEQAQDFQQEQNTTFTTGQGSKVEIAADGVPANAVLQPSSPLESITHDGEVTVSENQLQVPTAEIAVNEARQQQALNKQQAAANSEMQPIPAAARAGKEIRTAEESKTRGAQQLAGHVANPANRQVEADSKAQADDLEAGKSKKEAQLPVEKESIVMLIPEQPEINKNTKQRMAEGRETAKADVTPEVVLLPAPRLEQAPEGIEKKKEIVLADEGGSVTPRASEADTSEATKSRVTAQKVGEQPVIGATQKTTAPKEEAPAIAVGEEYYVLDSLPDTMKQDSLPAENTAKAADETVVPVPEKTFLRGWSLGAYFTPRFAYRSVTPRGEDDVLVTQMNNPKREGRERIGYEFGLSVLKAIGQRWSLESNIGILTQQNDLAYTYTNGEIASYERTVLPGGGIQINPVLVHHDRQLSSSATYGNLRIGANWYFWQSGYRRLHLSVATGANLLLNHKAEEYLNGQLLAANDELLRKSNYQLTLGIGYNRQIFTHWEIVAMPMLQYFVSNTFSDAVPLGVKPYTFGVQVQLRRSFF